MIDQFFRLLSMFAMVINICNSNEFNKQECMKDWNVWLYPELVKGWNLYTEKEVPYQEEKEKLDETNSES